MTWRTRRAARGLNHSELSSLPSRPSLSRAREALNLELQGEAVAALKVYNELIDAHYGGDAADDGGAGGGGDDRDIDIDDDAGDRGGALVGSAAAGAASATELATWDLRSLEARFVVTWHRRTSWLEPPKSHCHRGARRGTTSARASATVSSATGRRCASAAARSR